jgi:hypothetical protein
MNGQPLAPNGCGQGQMSGQQNPQQPTDRPFEHKQCSGIICAQREQDITPNQAHYLGMVTYASYQERFNHSNPIEQAERGIFSDACHMHKTSRVQCNTVGEHGVPLMARILFMGIYE